MPPTSSPSLALLVFASPAARSSEPPDAAGTRGRRGPRCGRPRRRSAGATWRSPAARRRPTPRAGSRSRRRSARSTVRVRASGYYAHELDRAGPHVGRRPGSSSSLGRRPPSTRPSTVVAPAPAAAPATQEVAPVQVLRTPGALDNVFRTLQTLPGVTATEEFGSRLAVRGGSPDQNLTVMDGVEIHDPYRLFGLTSAFNPEIIQRFELATGGFSVKYGDRLSSLLLVENRDGTRAERLGRIGVAQHHRRQRRARRRAARRRHRVVAGHRPPHLLRPGRRAAHRQPVPGLRRPAGQGGVGAGRRPHA